MQAAQPRRLYQPPQTPMRLGFRRGRAARRLGVVQRLTSVRLAAVATAAVAGMPMSTAFFSKLIFALALNIVVVFFALFALVGVGHYFFAVGALASAVFRILVARAFAARLRIVGAWLVGCFIVRHNVGWFLQRTGLIMELFVSNGLSQTPTSSCFDGAYFMKHALNTCSV